MDPEGGVISPQYESSDGPITTLVNHKEKPVRSDKALRAIVQVGQAVNMAVERFVTVGEAIADDNPEIKVEMYEACKEARAAGAAIEKLCEVHYDDQRQTRTCADKNSMVRAARVLLSSVTRVLLLADTVVVVQLLAAKDRVVSSLNRLENVNNFTEFVKAFSQFGGEMVELAHITGDRQNDMKDERRRAQMAAARQVLERATMMLLTSSKTCLRHPECETARENRDTVFCQMRRAMDLIHFVVKDGVMDNLANEPWHNGHSVSGTVNTTPSHYIDWDSNHTVHNAIKKFEDIVEMTRMTLVGSCYREKLISALDAIAERAQDFTDSAYTTHEHRESILLLCDRTKLELNQLLRTGLSMDQKESISPSDELEATIIKTLKASKDLKQQLQDTSLDQAAELLRADDMMDVLSTLRNAAMASDSRRLDEYSERFHDHVEHVQEVCKLLRHVASTDSLQVSAKQCESNIRIFGPQVICAAQTLCLYPTSKIAKENLDVFIDTWRSLFNDMNNLSREVSELCGTKVLEKQEYMSLPRPGKHGTTTKPLKPTKLDDEEQAKIAKLGLEMKLLTSEMDAETDKWEESDNDIVKRAKSMSSMTFAMYQFTRGEGELRTTQDLFTQAEFFCEEANRLYKVVRQFSCRVPGGAQKKELLECLDRVPTYVQQLQFTVRSPTVGKAATFTKVDNVIQDTKNLMNVISKVVTTCFTCATKYNLDFRGAEARSRTVSPYRSDGEDGGSFGLADGASGSPKGGGTSSDGSM